MPVDLKALSTGTKILIGAGLLLLIDTFLAWQEVSVEVSGVEVASASQNAWNGFWGVVMGLALIALLVWVGLQIFKVDILNLNVPEQTVTLVLAGIVFVFALLKNLIDDYSAWPSYVGVVLAAGVAVGAWLRTQETEGVAAATAPAATAPAAAPPAPAPTQPEATPPPASPPPAQSPPAPPAES
jgi:hypothetical protein